MRIAIKISQVCSQRDDELTATVGTYDGSLVCDVQPLNALQIRKKNPYHHTTVVYMLALENFVLYKSFSFSSPGILMI